MAMISLKEYALRHSKHVDSTRRKALTGGFKTAQKVGRDWLIDENEPYEDRRIKSGKYVDWRKQKKK